MTYEQVRDILEGIRAFHRRVRNELEEARRSAKDERTRFVLESIRRDEQAMDAALARYERGERNPVLDVWMQYVPDEEMRRLLRETHFKPELDPEDVVARKVQIDRALADFYRQLADQTSAPRAAELFERLAERTTQRLADESWQVRNGDLAPPRKRDRTAHGPAD